MKAQKILGHAALCLLPLGMFAQERADYQLKGVPAVEVTRFENGSDLIQQFTSGQVTAKDVANELEIVLKRYSLPLEIPSAGVPTAKDGVGMVVIVPHISGHPGESSATLALELQVL